MRRAIISKKPSSRTSSSLAAIFAAATLTAAHTVAAEPLLSFKERGVDLSVVPAGNSIELRSSLRQATEYDVFRISEPPRLVIDLYRDAPPSLYRRLTPADNDWISKVRVGSHPDRVRVVLDLDESAQGPIGWEKSKDRLVLNLGQSKGKEPGTEPRRSLGDAAEQRIDGRGLARMNPAALPKFDVEPKSTEPKRSDSKVSAPKAKESDAAKLIIRPHAHEKTENLARLDTGSSEKKGKEAIKKSEPKLPPPSLDAIEFPEKAHTAAKLSAKPAPKILELGRTKLDEDPVATAEEARALFRQAKVEARTSAADLIKEAKEELARESSGSAEQKPVEADLANLRDELNPREDTVGRFKIETSVRDVGGVKDREERIIGRAKSEGLDLREAVTEKAANESAPVPSKIEEPVAPKNPQTPPLRVGREVIPAPVEAVASSKTLDAISFEYADKDKAPVIKLKVSDYAQFFLVKKDAKTYRLALPDFKLKNKELGLVQFPPQDFKGFTMILAEEKPKGLELQIGVDANTRITAAIRDGQLWIRTL